MPDEIEDWGFVGINFLIILLHVLEASAVLVGVVAVGISVAYCLNAGLEIMAHRQKLKRQKRLAQSISKFPDKL